MDPQPDIDTPSSVAIEEPKPLTAASTGELVERLTHGVGELVKKEVELAKAELRADGRVEMKVVIAWAISAVCALVGVNLLFVAVVFAWLPTLPGWITALIAMGLTVSVGAVTGYIGWIHRVKRPLKRTQRTLKEDVQWVKQRLT